MLPLVRLLLWIDLPFCPGFICAPKQVIFRRRAAFEQDYKTLVSPDFGTLSRSILLRLAWLDSKTAFQRALGVYRKAVGGLALNSDLRCLDLTQQT